MAPSSPRKRPGSPVPSERRKRRSSSVESSVEQYRISAGLDCRSILMHRAKNFRLHREEDLSMAESTLEMKLAEIADIRFRLMEAYKAHEMHKHIKELTAVGAHSKVHAEDEENVELALDESERRVAEEEHCCILACRCLRRLEYAVSWARARLSSVEIDFAKELEKLDDLRRSRPAKNG